MDRPNFVVLDGIRFDVNRVIDYNVERNVNLEPAYSMSLDMGSYSFLSFYFDTEEELEEVLEELNRRASEPLKESYRSGW